MKTRTAVIVLAIGLTVVSCGTTPPGPPAPTERPQPVPENLEERFVYQIVFSLRDSFAAQDVTGFMRHVSEGFYMGSARLSQNLEAEFASSGRETVEIEILEVIVDDPRVTALVSWTRTPAVEGGAVKSGTTELIFQKGEKLSLVNFRKDVLFGISGF